MKLLCKCGHTAMAHPVEEYNTHCLYCACDGFKLENSRVLFAIFLFGLLLMTGCTIVKTDSGVPVFVYGRHANFETP